MKIKYSKFQEFLTNPTIADVELILKAKKLDNNKYQVTTSYELSLKQLNALNIKFKTSKKGVFMSRDSKAPKWANELIIDIKDMKKDIKDMKNTPTMRKELGENNGLINLGVEFKPPKWTIELIAEIKLISARLTSIENLPTIKKELKLFNN